MRLLIQRTPTAQFFHYGEWLSHKHLAQTFTDTRAVTRACLQYGLKSVRLVVTFDDDRPDLFLRLEE